MMDKTLTNDSSKLTPRITLGEPALKFDFPALHIGVAEYREGPTGCTVFYFPKGVSSAVDVRGGSPGVMGDYGFTHAICLAGGSLYGLEAASGVAAELFAMRGHSTKWFDIALASGAIIFDFGPRQNAIYPDKALGRAALKAAKPGLFPLGPCGAGCSATVGKGFEFNRGESSGQGGAFRQVGPTKIAVFTVVNALGAIVNRQGHIVRGHLDRQTHQRRPLHEDLESRLKMPEKLETPPGNTTLTVLVTNQKLDSRTLLQWGRQTHGSMARAIQPFHGHEDGDVLFAVTTGEVENPALNPMALGVLASELAWDAVLSCYGER